MFASLVLMSAIVNLMMSSVGGQDCRVHRSAKREGKLINYVSEKKRKNNVGEREHVAAVTFTPDLSGDVLLD